MNWKKLFIITILTLHIFGFGTAIAYIPLNPKQLKEIKTTITTQLNQGTITKAELSKLYNELLNIRQKLVSYQSNPNSNFMDEMGIYSFVAQIGYTNNELLSRLNLPNYLMQRPYDPKQPAILQDIKNIKVEVEDILSKTPKNDL